MDNKKKGIIYMIIASISFAIMAVMVKLSGGGIPIYQQLFFRNFLMIIFASSILIKTKQSIKINKNDRVVLFLRCSLGLAGMFCVFYANNHLYLANAQILQKLNPLFITIFAAFILNEKLTFKKIITVMLGFIGALIIINPSNSFDLKPSIIGVLSALFGGLAYMMVRLLKGRVNGMVIIFYFSLLSFIVTFPLMISVYKRPTILEWIYLLSIGVFAAIGQYFITKAYHNAPASEITIFDYSGVIISPVFGLLIFSEAISLRMIIGMLIIIISGYITSKKN